MNTSHRTGIYAVSDTFTGVGQNRMGHIVLSSFSSVLNLLYSNSDR